MKDRRFIGIDPGKNGGICVLRGSAIEYLRRMPNTERDIWNLIDDLPVGNVIIEKVHSRPGQSSVATFTFGTNYGLLRGFLIAAELPFDQCIPQKWQRYLGIRKKRAEESQSQWKNHLKSVAQQKHPNAHITLNTADALLIAEYCRRIHS